MIAENKVGMSEPCDMREPVVAKGKFDVPGAPGTPDPTEMSDTSCRVKWTAPRNDGGAPIRGYFVERRSGTKWIRVNKEPVEFLYLVVRDLIQGSDYQFRVCAVNIEGEGAYSKESDPATAKDRYSRPDPPIDLTYENVTKSSCLLTWRPPIRNGGLPITKYHVEKRTKGSYKFIRFTDDLITDCQYQVKDLIENNEYEFRVFAENKQGESLPSDPTRTFKARDQIHAVAPEIGEMPDLGHPIGTQGKIEVKVIGTPSPDIKWKKGSRELKLNSSKYSITYAQSVAVLFINNLVEEDAGQYTIEAENQAGAESKSCKYSVWMPPAIEYDNKYKKQSVVSVGSNFRIACQVLGCPKPEVVWYKNDLKITKGDKAVVENPTEQQYYLTIKSCDKTDCGVYSVKATNESGKDEAKFEVQIVDVPERPRGPLEITLEPEQARFAMLEWKEPRWDGGSELIGYSIEFAKNLEPIYSQSKFCFIRNLSQLY